MIVNSPSRLTKRRKEALERRTKNLTDWQGKLGADTENKDLKAKVEVAQTDIANLQKKVGNRYNIKDSDDGDKTK